MGRDSRSAGTLWPTDGALTHAVKALLARPEAPWLVALLALAGVCGRAFPYTVDDAYIVVRYADRLAGGAGYTFNAGAASDGVTSPLWLAVGFAGSKACGAALWALKLVGVGATLFSVRAVVRAARARCLGSAAGWLCAALCATSPPMATWAAAGLETGLATLLVASLAVAASSHARPNVFYVGVCVFWVPWLRPELVPHAWLLLLGCSPRNWRGWACAVAGVLSVAAFRLQMFGHLLPMTAFAKPGLVQHGFRYALDSLQPLPACALALCAFAAWRRPRQRVLVAALATHGAAVVLAGGDWMPAARLFVPVIPCAALLAADTLARVRLAELRTRRACTVALCLFWSLRVFWLATEVAEARRAGQWRATRVPQLAALIPPGDGPVVALDVGLLGVLLPGAIVDLAGLTEPRIAYARGAHLDKAVDSDWLRALRPRAVVLHSQSAPRVDDLGRVRWFSGFPVERRVVAMRWLSEDYRVAGTLQYAAAYHYVVWLPREIRPGPRGSVKAEAP